MQWSAIRKRFHEQLAACLSGRIDIHVTQYRDTSRMDLGRGWLTLDGREVLSVANPPFVASIGTCEVPGPQTESGWEGLGHSAAIVASSSIGDALQHSEEMVRALALLDRRCGKRRLRAIEVDSESHIEYLLLEMRRYMEGLTTARPRCPVCREAVIE